VKRAVWLVVVVAAVLGLAWPRLRPLLSAAPPESAATRVRSAEALQVAVYTVRPQPFVETISATGTLRAEEGVELQAETAGKVIRISFQEGAAVRRGDLLVKLNDADLRASLDRYVYGRELAASRERRYATLLAQKMVTQQDYDATLGELNVQKANVDLFLAQMEKTEVRAPFDGVVGLRYVSLGAYVSAATRIATLQRMDRLKIDFAIPEKYSGRVRPGAPIRFTVAGGVHEFTGRVYAIDPRIDSGTRTLLLRALCDNPGGALLPGAFANVSLPLEEIRDALLVPAEAVIPGLDEKNVYVMEAGVAQRRAVATGARTAAMVHVLGGIRAGDQVITSGLQTIRQGQKVAALREPPAARTPVAAASAP
jgi:membrane fusion protein, multidrug efflux system